MSLWIKNTDGEELRSNHHFSKKYFARCVFMSENQKQSPKDQFLLSLYCGFLLYPASYTHDIEPKAKHAYVENADRIV